MAELVLYSRFVSGEKNFTNFVFLWQFTKVLSAKINPELIPGMSNVTCSHVLMYLSTEWPGLLISSMPVGPLSMAMPVSSITAANKKMKQVVDGTAGERTLCYPSSMRHMTTSLLKRRHRYSSKWAGALNYGLHGVAQYRLVFSSFSDSSTK